MKRERQVISLNGEWSCAMDPDGEASSDEWAKALPNPQTVAIPHRWEDFEATQGYEGVLWYSRTITFPAKVGSSGVLLNLENPIGLTDVYFDGTLIGHFFGNGLTHRIRAHGEPGTQHLIVIRLDSRNVPRAIKRAVSCGLGPISMEILPPVRIDFLSTTTTPTAPNTCTLRYRISADESTPVTMRIDIGKTILHKTLSFTVPIGATNGEFQFQIRDLKRWSASSPNTYSLRAILKDANQNTIDTYQLRYGCCQAALNNEHRLVINGVPTILRGLRVPGGLPALSKQTITAMFAHEVSLAKDACFNAFMADGATLSEQLLDIADEQGIFIIADIPPTLQPSNEDDATYTPDITAVVEELGHHPSIIAWSWTSQQTPSTELAELHKIDPSRIAIIRENHHTTIYAPNQHDGQTINDIDAAIVRDDKATQQALQKAETDNAMLLLSGTTREIAFNDTLSGQRAEEMRQSNIRQMIESVLRAKHPLGYFIRPEQGASYTGLASATGSFTQAYIAANAFNQSNILLLRVTPGNDTFFQQGIVLYNERPLTGAFELFRLLTTPKGNTILTDIFANNQQVITAMDFGTKTTFSPPAIQAAEQGEYRLQFVLTKDGKTVASSQVLTFWSNGEKASK